LLTPFECLMEAKAAREVVRSTAMKALERGADAAELAAYVIADKLATANLQIAQDAYDSDSRFCSARPMFR
jgi:hypothetical protein